MHARQALSRMKQTLCLLYVLLNDIFHVPPDTQNRARTAQGARHSPTKESTGDKATAVPRALGILAWSLWSAGLCPIGEECYTTAPAKPRQSHRDLFRTLKILSAEPWLFWYG